jgi:hypothetical protein
MTEAAAGENGPAICSAKGCQNAATWMLRWNNPKIHSPERRKVWLACDEHREHLADFLNRRGMLRETVRFTESGGEQATASS